MSTNASSVRRWARNDLGALISTLLECGYRVAAPVVRDGALAFKEVESLDQVPAGIRDEQSPGDYKLHEPTGDRFFENAVGADSPKRFFFPPESELYASHLREGAFVLDRVQDDPPQWAVLGVRPCDLAAIATQDRVFLGDVGTEGPFRCETETYYERARERSLIIAVNCTAPAGNCFCASWGTGPRASEGFDLALTEVGAGFLVESGSAAGEEILRALGSREASDAEVELAEMKIERAREKMGRELRVDGLPETLSRNGDHRIWNYFATHCLGCGNCTMVCPTCFCSTVTDSTELASGAAVRTRRWESCFTHQLSQVTSGPVRSSSSARYRHWLTHKLSAWWEQFDRSGCVGCGRCLTWCPVGIEWTSEINQLQREDAARREFEKREVAEVTT